MAVLLLLFFAPAAQGQSTWNYFSSDPYTALGYWNYSGVFSSNWIGGIPTSSTNAIINNQGSALLSNSDPQGGGLGYYNKLDIGTTSGGSGYLYIGSGGQLSGTTAYLGSGAGGYGYVQVGGTGAQWNNSGYLLVGASGTGELYIYGGGKVTSGSSSGSLYGVLGNDAGSTGTVTVDGTGSQWTNNYDLYVGGGGDGELTVQNGGKVTSAHGSIANSGTSIGYAKVTGSGSQWVNSGDLYVGNSGQGTLLIQSGGAVMDANAYIARNSGSVSLVDVFDTNSKWTTSGDLYVGDSGNGTLSIRLGGTVSVSGSSLIGRSSGGTGNATVDGAGSLWSTTSGIFQVGRGGNGTLTVQNGGTVSVTGSSYIGAEGGTGTATVTGAGSLWSTGGILYVGAGSPGTLTVDAGGKVTATTRVGMADSGSAKGTLNLNGTSGSQGVLETPFVSKGTGSGGATINFNGGILRATANQVSFLQGFATGDVQIQSGGAFIDSNNFNIGISTVLQGTGGLTKQGAGILTLSAASTYVGGTTISAGTLALSGAGALPTSSAVNLSGSTAVFDISGISASSATIGSLAGVTGSSLVLGGKTLVTAGSGSTVFAGVISGTGGLTKTGAGTLTLSGVNTFTGGVSISGGTLKVGTLAAKGNDQPLGKSTGALNLSGGGALQYTGGDVTWNRDITVSSGTGTLTNSGGGLLTLTGTLTKNGTTLTFQGGSFAVTGSGTITGSAAGSDLVVDNANVTLATANSYNGPTYIRNAGVLNANAANALPTSPARSDIIMDDSGSGSSHLNLGANQSVASLTGASSSQIGLGGNNLTVGASTGSTTFAGTITGPGSLTKDNASTQIFTGASSYNGDTIVDGGTLQISSGGSVSNAQGYIGYSSGSNATVSVTGAGSQWTNTGVLRIGNSGKGTLNILAGGTVTSGVGIVGTLPGSSTSMVTVDGAGSTWNLGSNELRVGNSASGTLNIQNGGKVISGVGTIGLSDNITGTVNVTGAGSLWNASSIEVNAGNSLTHATLTVDAGGRVEAGYIYASYSGAGSGVINVNGTEGNRGVVQVTSRIEQDGPGGYLNFNGGTLIAGANTSSILQNFQAGHVQIQGGGLFVDTQGFNVGISAPLQGDGGLTKLGSGKLTLNAAPAANTFTGPVNITAGSLVMGTANQISGNALVLSGGTFNSNGFNQTLGTLTLTANSIIDFSSGGSSLTFADSSGTPLWNGTLSIWNYDGSNGADHLFFGNSGLTSDELSRIQFFSGSGTGSLGGGSFIGGGELAPSSIVPVPEPTAVLSVLLLLLAIGWKERHHFMRVRRLPLQSESTFAACLN